MPPFLFTVASLLFLAPLNATSYSWGTSISGYWSDPASWSPSTGIPSGPGDTASLSVSGVPYDVILDADYTVSQFINDGDARFSATGRIFTVNGDSSFAGGATDFTNSSYVSNGSLSHTAGQIDLTGSSIAGTGFFSQSGGHLNLDASALHLPGSQTGGVITLTGDCQIDGGFHNIAGTIELFAPTETDQPTNVTLGGNDLENSGLLRLLSGPPATFAPAITLTAC